MRVAVLGAGGQLGAALVRALGELHDVAALDRAALDITDADAIERVLGSLRPEALINCASYNAVDAAEEHPVEALEVNAFGVRSLARFARAHGAALVHYSSDFVFDGRTETPYTEDDRPNPQSVYATSKLLGEWFAADVPRAYVLRVESLFGSTPGGPPPRGSLEAILQGLRTRTAVKVFVDRTVSPTSIQDVAAATRTLLERNLPPGLYHCVSSGHATWMEVAREAARLLAVEPRLEPTTLGAVALRAARPAFCALSNRKLAAAGIAMPAWQDALARYLESHRDG